ncbi:hypothetical protein IE077_004599 [Cardiosporidium cionae]|uniref:Uncharacterized protein n=1 Tax=Cardiosporidium cionae TaxID=476202 RepID=A0ABQ7J792_9APIC|nr:hypothetical protein IE077_004599 [Cardiosporidium cionae]|eukprot:KAF8819845.1 hypothetical protein IE077_004599 [Cardiosporidium cionae]
MNTPIPPNYDFLNDFSLACVDINPSFSIKNTTVVLAFLESSDARTFRSLIRKVPRVLGFKWKADFIAETLLACALIGHTDGKVYQRMSQYLQHSRIDQISTPTLLCDLVAALVKIQRSEITLFHQIVKRAAQQPSFLHMEHLISLARFFKSESNSKSESNTKFESNSKSEDFSLLHFISPELMALMTIPLRYDQLKECSPSAVTYLPLIVHAWCVAAYEIHAFIPLLQCLVDVISHSSECLQRPPSFYQDKDKSWAKILENQTESLGHHVTPTACSLSNISSLLHTPFKTLPMSVDEAVILLRGMDQLRLRSEEILVAVAEAIITHWRAVQAAHLPTLLHAFGNLNFTTESLMSLLETLVLKYATFLNEDEVLSCLWGSYTCGFTGESPAFQSLLMCFSHRSKDIEPIALGILQILAMCLRIDGREVSHRCRIPAAVARFCKYIETEFAWSPTSLSTGMPPYRMQAISQSLKKRKIPHYQNHPFYPFIIPIAIPDIISSSLGGAAAMTSPSAARYSQDWTVHEMKTCMIDSTSEQKSLCASPSETPCDDALDRPLSSSHSPLDVDSPSLKLPLKISFSHIDGTVEMDAP